jgi:hypothetical protein
LEGDLAKGKKISQKDSRKLAHALQKAKGDSPLYRRIQMVHLRAAHGMGQEEIAKATLEEETAFLKGFIHQAGAGELVCVQDIQTAYEKRLGRKTGSSTIYALLERHDWRKLMPRPHHPHRNLEAQKSFKKTSKG